MDNTIKIIMAMAAATAGIDNDLPSRCGCDPTCACAGQQGGQCGCTATKQPRKARYGPCRRCGDDCQCEANGLTCCCRDQPEGVARGQAPCGAAICGACDCQFGGVCDCPPDLQAGKHSVTIRDTGETREVEVADGPHPRGRYAPVTDQYGTTRQVFVEDRPAPQRQVQRQPVQRQPAQNLRTTPVRQAQPRPTYYFQAPAAQPIRSAPIRRSGGC